MDYKVTDTELTNVANAIRAKGGTSAPLEWDSGFVSAISAIPSGDGMGFPFVTTCHISNSGPVWFRGNFVSHFTDRYACLRPLDANQSILDVDWSNPFEIYFEFKYSQTHVYSQVLFGGFTSFYSCPSIELSSNGAGIWCGLSSGGGSWTYSMSFGSADGVDLQPDTLMSVKAIYDGSDYTVVFNDGSNTYTKSMAIPTAPYHGSAEGSRLEIGGVSQSGNHCAKYVSIKLSTAYIKSNGVMVWGAGVE